MSGSTPLRPVESPPGFGDVETPLQAILQMPVFAALTESERERIAEIASIVRIPQDRIVPRAAAPTEEAAYCFVVKGQVAFAEFAPGTIPAEPASKKKRVTPVMQVAKKSVAMFDAGELFANDHVENMRSDDGEKVDAALFTCVPVVLLRVPKAKLTEILEDVPALKDAIDAIAEAAYYRQTFLKVDGRDEIFDFYIREGFEYAQAIKVVQTDKCIDCDECVKACEDRHGISRIERFGPQVGLIQFTLNCRTCVDARCISPCNFDAIAFDEEAQEVVVYDNCVGCTLCAKACPHEAIRMVDVVAQQAPDLVQLARKGADQPGTVVAEGERAAKKKKPKRIANKCDHCLGYEDMACITACPTGAIIQIDPRSLFRRDGGLIERAQDYFDPAPFEQGYANVAGTQGVTAMRALFAGVALAVLGCFWEYGARQWSADLSLYRQLISAIEGPAVAGKLALNYSAVSGFGRWLGYIGAAMMVVSALYTLRLHVPGIRRIGSSKTWFDFHVVFGLAGPLLSLLHTDFNVFQLYWVSALWWAVFGVVITGVVGRYLYTLIPRIEVAADRDKKSLDGAILKVADRWSALTRSANVMQHFLKAQEKRAEREEPSAHTGVLRLTAFLLAAELRRIRAAVAIRFRMLGDMQNTELRRTAIKLMARRAAVERRTEALGVARRLMTKWRAFHIGLSIIMLLLLVAHAAISIWATGL